VRCQEIPPRCRRRQDFPTEQGGIAWRWSVHSTRARGFLDLRAELGNRTQQRRGVGRTTADRKCRYCSNLGLEAPPGFEPGMEVFRQGRDAYLVDSSCFLVGPTTPFSPVFGRNCSQVVPKPGDVQRVGRPRAAAAPPASRQAAPARPRRHQGNQKGGADRRHDVASLAGSSLLFSPSGPVVR
jgi:hypothetical protein